MLPLPHRCSPALSALLLAGGLHAQGGAAAPQEPSPRLQGYPHEHDADAGLPWDQRPHLTGSWGGLRPWLRANGLTLDVFATTDASVIASGGRNPGGTAVRALLDATLTADTARLFGLAGGTLFADFQCLRGGDGSDDTGDLQRWSDIDHVHSFAAVAMLWYEQALAADTVFVKVGKNDVNTEFAMVENGDHFVHPSFGHSPNQLGMPTYPDTAFGAQAFLRPGAWYAGAGVYDGALQAGVPVGERGPRTLFAAPDDLFAIGETGARWSSRLAGRAGVGAWRHTGEFVRYDGGSRNGTSGVYAVLDQQLWRADGEGERRLGGFLMYAWADPRLSAIEHHVAGGLQWCGPSAARPQDVAGLGATFASFSQQPAAGLDGPGELAVEAFYEVGVTPWLQLKPVVTWIHDPGGQPGVGDAWVLTLRSAVTF